MRRPADYLLTFCLLATRHTSIRINEKNSTEELSPARHRTPPTLALQVSGSLESAEAHRVEGESKHPETNLLDLDSRLRGE